MDGILVSMRMKNDPRVKLRVKEEILKHNLYAEVHSWHESPDPKNRNYLFVSCGWKPVPSEKGCITSPQLFEELKKNRDPDVQFYTDIIGFYI